MQGVRTAPALMGMPNTRIAPFLDASQVLHIVNSDVAQSGIDASDHASKFHLVSRQLAFNFGANLVGSAQLAPADFTAGTTYTCQTAPYAGQSIYNAILHYRQDNPGLQCLIASTYTPHRVFNGFTYQPVECYMASLALASSPIYVGQTRPIGALSPPNLTQLAGSLVAGWPGQFSVFSGVQPTASLVPGRLGCFGTGSVVQELTIQGGGRCYDNAIPTGLAAQTVDHKGHTHAFTDNLSYDPGATGAYMSAARNATAITDATGWGFTSIINMGVDRPWAPDNGAMPAWDSGDITGSGYPALNLFAYCIGTPWNANWSTWSGPGSINWVNNYNVVSGGWWYDWTSNAYVTGMDFLWKGGAAAIVTVQEPFANGIPLADEVFRFAKLFKLPLAYAAYISSYGVANYTVVGCPLYAPYGAS